MFTMTLVPTLTSVVLLTSIATVALASPAGPAAGRRIGLFQVHLVKVVVTRRSDDRGEGVISMAIAVLIVAFLGVALWLAFKGFADDTERTLEDQVDQIGS